MSFDPEKMLESKRAFRRDLARRPIGEKLRILDALRERELAIRGRTGDPGAGNLHEAPATYRARDRE